MSDHKECTICPSVSDYKGCDKLRQWLCDNGFTIIGDSRYFNSASNWCAYRQQAIYNIKRGHQFSVVTQIQKFNSGTFPRLAHDAATIESCGATFEACSNLFFAEYPVARLYGEENGIACAWREFAGGITDAFSQRVDRGTVRHDEPSQRELSHLAGVVGALRDRSDQLMGLLRDVERETRQPGERFDEVWAEVREVLRG